MSAKWVYRFATSCNLAKKPVYPRTSATNTHPLWCDSFVLHTNIPEQLPMAFHPATSTVDPFKPSIAFSVENILGTQKESRDDAELHSPPPRRATLVQWIPTSSNMGLPPPNEGPRFPLPPPHELPDPQRRSPPPKRGRSRSPRHRRSRNRSESPVRWARHSSRRLVHLGDHPTDQPLRSSIHQQYLGQQLLLDSRLNPRL